MTKWLTILLVGTSVVTSEADTPNSKGLVVIDAGHGGDNGGAPGRTPTAEKYFTLALAKKVEAKLARKGFSIVMTRRQDKPLTLRQRGDIARSVGADVFVSIHANASPYHDQRGFETFVLSGKAVSVDSPALRTGRMPLRESMVADYQAAASRKMSVRLAQAVHKQLRRYWGKNGDRGVKQQNMHVLLGLPMPSILVEVGFLDHPIEGKQLLEDTTQEKLAEAIAAGVDDYLSAK